MNIALGAKILLWLIFGTQEWWKEAIVKKYFHSSRKRCLDKPLLEEQGSPIWQLCKAAAPLLQSSCMDSR
jgi:hypothetical protein